MISQKPVQPATRKTTFNYGYIIVLVSFVIVMMNVGMYLTIGVFFKPISLEMGWTRADTSLPIALSTIITAVCTIIAGNYFDKFGPRKTAFVFAIITGTGYLLMSTLSNLWQLYIYFGSPAFTYSPLVYRRADRNGWRHLGRRRSWRTVYAFGS
jgi:MFS family permease